MKIKSKKLEYLLVISIIKTLNSLPLSCAYNVGSWLADLWYFIDRRRKHIALDNLNKAFGKKKSKSEIKKIAKGSFRNLLIIIIEISRIYSSKEKWIDNVVEVEGISNLDEARKKGKGVLIFTAHIGNWELAGLTLGKHHTPINIVTRKLDNIMLEKEAIKIRTLFENKIIYKKGAVRTILKRLREKEIIAMLIDQNTIKKEGVFVDFFDRLACTTPVLAILALRVGAPVVPVFAIRKSLGKYKLIIGKEVKIKNTGVKLKDIYYNTALFTKIIESYVDTYPDQWLWMHRRWKTQQ